MNSELNSNRNNVLIKTTNNGAEAYTIAGLLEANGITPNIVVKGVAPATGRLDGAMPLYKIYVNEQFVKEAIELIAVRNDGADYDNYEWKKHKQNEVKRGAFFGRAVMLMFAILFYSLSLLPMKEADNVMKYLLQGGTFCFILLFFFSFYHGKDAIRK